MERSARQPYSDPVNWLFRSRESGRITIAQWPNPPLLLFLVATGARLLLQPRGRAATIVGAVATLALVAWALLEVFRGANPFRRILGAIVLAVQLVALLSR